MPQYNFVRVHFYLCLPFIYLDFVLWKTMPVPSHSHLPMRVDVSDCLPQYISIYIVLLDGVYVSMHHPFCSNSSLSPLSLPLLLKFNQIPSTGLGHKMMHINDLFIQVSWYFLGIHLSYLLVSYSPMSV